MEARSVILSSLFVPYRPEILKAFVIDFCFSMPSPLTEMFPGVVDLGTPLLPIDEVFWGVRARSWVL